MGVASVVVFVAIWLGAVIAWMTAARALRRWRGHRGTFMPLDEWKRLHRDVSATAAMARNRIGIFAALVALGIAWALFTVAAH